MVEGMISPSVQKLTGAVGGAIGSGASKRKGSVVQTEACTTRVRGPAGGLALPVGRADRG